MIADEASTNHDSSYTGYNHYSHQQEVAQLATVLFSLTLSLLGSSTIVYLLIKTGKWRTELYHRLVAGLTIMDLITSTAGVFMPFALPKETGKPFARGNFQTCSWAGFFLLFFLGAAFYNVALALYFCLRITYGWKENIIQKRMEPWIHIICFGTPLIVGVTGMLKDLINPDPFTGNCASEPYPFDCMLQDDVDCQRGSADSLLITIMTAIYFTAVTLGIFFTIWVYLSVRKQTQRAVQISFTGQMDANQNRRIRAVGQQAMLYTAAFLNGFSAILLYVVMGEVFFSNIDSTEELKDEPGIFPTSLVILLLFPLQGFWNFLIYIRPRLIRWKQANQDKSGFWAFQMVLTGEQPTTIAETSIHAQRSKKSSSFVGSGEVQNSTPNMSGAVVLDLP